MMGSYITSLAIFVNINMTAITKFKSHFKRRSDGYVPAPRESHLTAETLHEVERLNLDRKKIDVQRQEILSEYI